MTNKAWMVDSFFTTIGDPNDWDFTGQIIDNRYATGYCVCGHNIRYEYIIKNKTTGKTEKLGSECINHFKEYNEELYNLLVVAKREMEEERKAKLRETRDSAYKAEYDENLETIVCIFNELHEKYIHLGGGQGQRVPRPLWDAIASWTCKIKTSCNKKYKTWRGYAQWSRKELATALSYQHDCENIHCTDANKYVEPVFNGVIWFGKYKDTLIEQLPKNYLKWIVENYIPHNAIANQMVNQASHILTSGV